MNILFICSYPNNIDINRSVFVYRLVQSLVEIGCNIIVISPENWRNNSVDYCSLPGNMEYGSEAATVYRPKYFDFPNRIRIGSFSLGQYNILTYNKTVRKILKELKFKPDLIYAHFLYRSGPAAIMASDFFSVPAVVALGESTMEKHLKVFSKNKMRKLIHQFSGIISVSTKNKNYCIEELGMSPDKIKVFPNSVNHKVFYPRDKYKMREKYNLPHDKFITAFTGHFIERKGPLRVLEAINKINGNIGGIFLGSGPQEPFGDKVLFKDRVSQNHVAELLSASDIFVLPTKNEGSCNAIVEAMACGLPIISSNIESVKEQVNQKNGILCNPIEINEIKNAIQVLKSNPEMIEDKRKEALKTAKSSSIEKRAMDILEFLNKQLKSSSECGKINL